MKSLLNPVESAWHAALTGGPEALYEMISPDRVPERLQIYLNSIRGTLKKVLEKTFKPLKILVGEAVFEELCSRYVRAEYSHHLVLNRYGANFAGFVGDSPYMQDFPYLEDFAEFCYLWRQVYVQQKSQGIQMVSAYPVYEIWQRCQPEYQGVSEIENWEGPFEYVLCRDRNKVKIWEIKKPAIHP